MDYKKGYIALTREEIIDFLKNQLNEKRFQHSLRVEKTALSLADHYGADLEKASIAALLHDSMKQEDDETMREYIIAENMDIEYLKYGNAIWHGPIAADYAHKNFSVTDEEILSAIKYHTTGSEEMTTIDKIIFAADEIEPGRNQPGVEELRKLAYEDLDRYVGVSVKRTLEYLLSKSAVIYPKTVTTYNKWSTQ